MNKATHKNTLLARSFGIAYPQLRSSHLHSTVPKDKEGTFLFDDFANYFDTRGYMSLPDIAKLRKKSKATIRYTTDRYNIKTKRILNTLWIDKVILLRL